MDTRWTVGAALAALVASGCASLGSRPPAQPPPRQAPGSVAVRMTTNLPDAYEVLSGPVETYRLVHVNARLKVLLETYGREKSGVGGAPLEILVHLERLNTRYRQIGSQEAPRVRYARAEPARGTLSDAWAFGGPEREFGERDTSRPEQITKVVDVALTVEVRQGGQALRSEPVSVSVAEVVERADIDAWTYDYGPLIYEALRRSVVAVDAVVERALGRGG